MLPIHCAVMAKSNKVDILKYLIEVIGVNPDEKNKVCIIAVGSV